MKISFAIYTAGHGLGWWFDSNEFALDELEHLRMKFGPFPDFDYGEKGFEGVFVKDRRTYLVKCLKAEKWDFKGRDALYFVVGRVDSATLSKGAINRIFRIKEMAIAQKDDIASVEISEIEEKASETFQENVVYKRNEGENVMTPAEEYINSNENTSKDQPQTDNGASPVNSPNNILPRIAAVIIFLGALGVGTFLSKVLSGSGSFGSQVMGFAVFAAGIWLAKGLWKAK